jgi:outer membrane protein
MIGERFDQRGFAMDVRHRLGVSIGAMMAACALSLPALAQVSLQPPAQASGGQSAGQTPGQPTGQQVAPGLVAPRPPSPGGSSFAQPPGGQHAYTPPRQTGGQAQNTAALKVTNAGLQPAGQKDRVPHTLAEALAATYLGQPALQAERAKLRATDENVPAALSGWRPTVVMAGAAGYANTVSNIYTPNVIPNSKGWAFSVAPRQIATGQATLTQNIYDGGKTPAAINQAKNQVMAERATLLQQEQTSFGSAISAYVNVIQYRQLLALNKNNVQVLARQLQATNDRFRVGEITQTDVAQAEAALAGAQAQLETAQGSLLTANGEFVHIIGFYPPDDLVEPQPIALPVRTEQDATKLAASNNPQVVSALFSDAADRDAVDAAFAQLLPQVSVQAQAFSQQNAQFRSYQSNGYQVLASLSVPLYQGGAQYAAVRAAKQTEQAARKNVDDVRRSVVQNAVQAWETLVSARAAAESTRVQIRANQVALQGVEREAIVGSRTTLDVLNAQQALLSSQETLVQNLAQLVSASYNVAAAIGRLTASDLHLPVPLYDATAYYRAVKDKWAGLGDSATDQPGR